MCAYSFRAMPDMKRADWAGRTVLRLTILSACQGLSRAWESKRSLAGVVINGDQILP